MGYPFNRTSMELKRVMDPFFSVGLWTFNRTSMELKLCPNLYFSHFHFSFNRTSMELKLLIQVSLNLEFRRLLIEPVWN